jgi:hypothetical protein
MRNIHRAIFAKKENEIKEYIPLARKNEEYLPSEGKMKNINPSKEIGRIFTPKKKNKEHIF